MNYGNSCVYAKPWIGNCNYSGAYEILDHIYGKLKVIRYFVLLTHPVTKFITQEIDNKCKDAQTQ